MAMTPTNKINSQMRNLLILTKKVLMLIRGSKLGIAGLSIIFAFVFMAVFAPWLAPYKVSFIAPAEDIFNIDRLEIIYPPADGYHPIIIGPTTPGEPSMGGGMWFILANMNGTIIMDFAQKSQTEDPFDQGNLSITLDVTTHDGVEMPISKVMYVAPARGYDSIMAVSTTYGERVRSGLLTFMANSTFVIMDPFSDSILFKEDVDFTPTWMNQDTTSAANMLNPPSQKKITNMWVSTLYGPMRYVNLASEDHIVTYEFEYCW
ncbi:MAG: hypothetical protein Q7J68_04140, partial [Thermoplasmata archaeon]|nr:hypothetical protein [Thermoplasmata archaeon]